MMKKTLVLAAILAVVAVSTQAAVDIWQGGDGDYANGANWSTGLIPQSGDSHGLINDNTVVQPTISTAIGQAPTTLGIGWDNPYGELNVAPGGSIVANDVYLGFDGNVPSKGVLNVNGNMIIGGTLTLGGSNGSTGTVHLIGGFLHLANLPTLQGGSLDIKSFQFENNGFLLINGNWAGQGFPAYMTAPAGKTIAEVYNSTDGRTEWTVVPEPATLGLLAILGLAFLRRK